jgi:small subunit ribosomal protein S18
MAEEITDENKRSWNPLDLDFTDAEILARYVTETGKILPNRMTKLSTRQQRHVTKAIKRARNMLLML